MLDEVKELQDNAVSQLLSLIAKKNEITFKAPTGSGKTHMMADFMNRVLSEKSDVVFIVSSLSKAELAKQNYDAFESYIADGKFTNLNPYLINSENGTEGSLYIPLDYNVYVLPRDLYKAKSKLKDGAALLNFLNEIKQIGMGDGKDIYVIKDECHVATTNLDDLKDTFFTKVINFSATPNLKRGQKPDVEILEASAVNAHLIKSVKYCDDTDTLDDALEQFIKVKKSYLSNSINVNPCMIIQISNEDKADEEINQIKKSLEKYQLKWMLILDNSEKKSETNDTIQLKKQPLSKWKYFAKQDQSTIDIIIFKMIITEGWDIRRACMLYQVRDTKSKQLDEQVIGRVRRNPRLIDFEKLSEDAQKLISTAYVWGIRPKEENLSQQMTLLFGDEKDNTIQKEIKIRTTRLKDFKTNNAIDIDSLQLTDKNELTPKSIFDLYREVNKTTLEVQTRYSDYVDTYDKFFKFGNNITEIKKAINDYCCDYATVMEITNNNGRIYETSVPYKSSYIKTDYQRNIGDWVWRRDDGNDEFSFDSEAEKEWLKKLVDLEKLKLIKSIDVDNDTIYLLGKNFLENSEIKYEYYNFGRHFSFPDFIMKDIKDRIHIFEVKSVNISGSLNIDSEDYKAKVKSLKEFYTAVSSKVPYYFYLPIKKDNNWIIWIMNNGKIKDYSYDDFVAELKN